MRNGCLPALSGQHLVAVGGRRESVGRTRRQRAVGAGGRRRVVLVRAAAHRAQPAAPAHAARTHYPELFGR